jgi:hypothetical protein
MSIIDTETIAAKHQAERLRVIRLLAGQRAKGLA